MQDKKMKTRQLGVLFVAGGSAVMLLPYYLHHSGGFDFGDWGGGHKGEVGYLSWPSRLIVMFFLASRARANTHSLGLAA